LWLPIDIEATFFALRTQRGRKRLVARAPAPEGGARLAEIAKATDWQNHSIRGFISGMLTKKMGLAVESAKNDSGERMYRIA
jgi:hypothetical protein